MLKVFLENTASMLLLLWCMLLFVLGPYVTAICLGGVMPTCLESISENEATERLEYILNKYEEVDMKITGTPVGVHGKRISEGDTEELYIVFQYIDNTVHDIMQTCTFILNTRPNECETISTVCNTFLPITPRPLLKREDLTVCDDEETTASSHGIDSEEFAATSHVNSHSP